MMEAITVVVAVNDDAVLEANLLRSPELRGERNPQLLVQRGFTSAALAYNAALDAAAHDLVVFVHQDVYFPAGWFDGLAASVTSLSGQRPWGVLGCYGSRREGGPWLGRVYTRGWGAQGEVLEQAAEVDTLDEVVLILRKSSGLRFDAGLPHFHLYGTDICLAAAAKGLTNYALPGYCIHNTNQLLRLPPDFYRCYHYVRRKWAEALPIQTSCIRITASNAPAYRRRLIEAAQGWLHPGRRAVTRVADPRALDAHSV